MTSIPDFEHLRHELKTYLNQIIGFCDILIAEARELGKMELVAGIDLILQKSEKIKRLIAMHLEKSTLSIKKLNVEEIRKALLIPLTQIINDSQGMIILYKNHAPFFVGDMEQLLTVVTEMYAIVEAKLIDLQVQETTLNIRTSTSEIQSSGAELPELLDATALSEDDYAEPELPQIPAKILVIDDNIAYHRLISRHLLTLGHLVHCVNSGKIALDYLAKNLVDIIILDVLMPGMSGFNILRTLKQDPLLYTIPIIMISAMDSSTSIAQCIKLGAEDFLPKDFDPIILRARLNACLQKKLLQDQQNIFMNALVKSQQNLETELADAASYIVSLLPQPLQKPIKAAVSLIPSARLGGDFCAFHWLDQENLAIYLLDVSGHGIKSALLAVSLSNTIRTKGLPNTDFLDPGTVLSSLNRSFQANDNQSVFFSLWYGVFNLHSGILRYACGGSPPACVIRFSDPNTCEILEGRDLVLGAAEEYTYGNREITLGKGDRLILYSDGLYEITGKDGSMLGILEFQNILPLHSQEPANNIQTIIKTVLSLTKNDSFQDDICLLEIQF